MKHLITAASLVALGTISANAASPTVTTSERSKPWSVSASLRGFYDDNPNTAPSGFEEKSFGLQFTPSGSISLKNDQTAFRASYIYDIKWYEAREDNSYDQSHQFDANLRHVFSPRYKIELSENFVIAQEPEVIDQSGLISIPLRTEGDNIRNLASVDFYAELTELLGLVVGYSNTYYNYEQDGFRSRSALLDRMQHLGTVNLRYQFQRETVGIFGYQYGIVNHLSDEEIAFGVDAEARDSRSHYVYLGVDHQFTSQLNGSARAGAQHTDYVNAGESQVSPYADVSLTYLYTAGSHIQAGLRHARNQTDIAVLDATGAITLDQESTTLYANWSHAITAKLRSNVLGQFQTSSFNSGEVDGSRDNYYMLGLNLNYQINNMWSAETGYNYDRLNSDLDNRGFSRNRLYIGIKVQY